ncbi:MAG: S-methyl-5'-thioadenosine phosphorylase [Candidatus Magasanikbacteria bacterium]
MLKIGIIGGSGLDDPKILENSRDWEVKTPYGATSSLLKLGEIAGVEVALIARHGREHTVPPTQVNYRANIWALKDWGATHILATTAVGSLRAEIGRGHLVVLDQFIDFTRHRFSSFYESFEAGKNGHTPMADPFDEKLRDLFIAGCRDLSLTHHPRGTVVTIEGPRFSTRAESHMFRAWGADVINMSIAPEAALARELGLPYGAVAMSTDYDCWKADEEPVTHEAVLKVFAQNAHNVTNLLVEVIKKIKAVYQLSS